MLRGLLWFAVAAGGAFGHQADDSVVLLQTAAKVVASSEKPPHVQAVQTSHRKSAHHIAQHGNQKHHHHHSEKHMSSKHHQHSKRSRHHHSKKHVSSKHHQHSKRSHARKHGKHNKKQHSKEADEEPAGIGAQAELSKEGYESVLAEKDNDQMTIFLTRVAEDDLNFTISQSPADKPAIAGVVPYYSGVKAARGYGQLQAELKRLAKVDGSWVIPRGVAASMDEVGFKKVALLEDVQEMSDFIERLAHEKADSVVDDSAALKKFAKLVLKQGHFDSMRQKLIDVTKEKKGWLKREHPWINLMELS